MFMKDCCDREIIPWRAWAQRGLPGEPVRDMLAEAVEIRFGQTTIGSTKLEFLGDNGGAYRAHETHALARELGIEPIHTPVCSPQSNGIAESFVNTFKRAYVNLMDRSSAEIVLAQLPDAFTHFNKVHPHSALNGNRLACSGGSWNAGLRKTALIRRWAVSGYTGAKTSTRDCHKFCVLGNLMSVINRTMDATHKKEQCRP